MDEISENSKQRSYNPDEECEKLVRKIRCLIEAKQRFTRGYKRYKETSGLMEWKIGHIFHSIFT